MKRYIDEKTGEIVNILEKEEANKVVKILIDYFFSETSMPAGRLNLVGFLKDFIKLGDIEDLNKIVEYIGEYKKGLKLSKEDEENFEVLYKFFRMYKDLEDSKLGIEDATNYISEMTNKKEELSKKEEKDMTKKDKILKVFFDNGFEFKRLAKVACEAWENYLKEQMSGNKKEIYVSLEQEIAYQDLLEFVSSDNTDISINDDIKVGADKKQIESKPEVNIKVEQTEEKKVEKSKVEDEKDEQTDNVSKVDINVQVPDRKEPVKIEIETKREPIQQEKVGDKVDEKSHQSVATHDKVTNSENVNKEQEKIHTIQIDPLAGEHDEIISTSNNATKPQTAHKTENHHNITQHDINSLLGLDDDLMNNSNNTHHKEVNAEKVGSVNKEQEKIHTIQINPLVDDEENTKNIQHNNEEKNKREQGYTSNIHVFVPGSDDVKQGSNVNPSEVKKATENLDLKDSVDFFNNVLDDMTSRKIPLDDDSEDDFRD